ncbi:hypothetical protein LCI18_000208 [Fusarium solani-melongenae]|uniref:Uncharacterized protein n=1 Tax=Fusarium solani subsp. cucurbitae TaxID=2747967 RepID=A0ACD3YK95_FUSSC|nr:hypothetical protein LCI18_000208 [Fusarium solani-melongenae]
MNWLSLPPELRNMILERLLDHKEIAPYATVSKEWRDVIENRKFSHLKLHPTCLDFLAQLAEEQTAQIDHIWLNIELKRYTCRACGNDESGTWSRLNDKIIATSVAWLFSILANWNWKKAKFERHLTLELNTYSPSDSEHWFKDCYFGAPGEDKFELLAQSGNVHDPRHGWWHGRNTEAPPDGALRRPSEPSHVNFEKDAQELPFVHIVTKFILRRQCRRQLNPLALSHLWSKLPRLDEICYEPWQLSIRYTYHWWERKMISRRLPTSIKKVTIFEDFNENYLGLFRLCREPDSWLNLDRLRIPTPAIGAAFAARSRQLEHLSVAFLIDAHDFFNACQPHWRWNRLVSLSLTSRTISKTTPHETNKLLRVAAKVALNMPKLERMVLWNGSRGVACSFTYCQGDDASLVWKGTWDLKLEPEVLDARGAVVVVEKQVLTDEIGSHGDAIKYLGLQSVVDEVSLLQITKENSRV